MPARYRSLRTKGMTFYGVDEAMQGLNQRLEKIKQKTVRGLIRAQARIFEDMDSRRPMMPVDTGNLRRSYYAVTSNGTVIHGRSPNFVDAPNEPMSQLYTDHIEALASAMEETIRIGINRGPAIVFGFSSFYAPYMENKTMAKKGERSWVREGSGPHFFESALKRNRNEVARIIREEAEKST